MSTDLKTIKNTGKDKVDLTITAFGSKRGPMIQLTQGFGGACALTSLDTDEVGHIQLTIADAYQVIRELSIWIKDETKRKADQLQVKINNDERLKKTIFEDAVKCQHFIDDLKVLEIPLRLWGS